MIPVVIVVVPMIMIVMLTPVTAVMIVVVATLLTMLFFAMRHAVRRVDVSIPAVGYKVDRSVARVVFAAMPGPVLFVSRRHVQIERLWRRSGDHRRGRNDYRRSWNDELWGGKSAADDNLSVQSRRVDVHRYADISSQRRGREQRDDTGDRAFGEKKSCSMLHRTHLGFAVKRAHGISCVASGGPVAFLLDRSYFRLRGKS
jgi:hypothetical protein